MAMTLDGLLPAEFDEDGNASNAQTVLNTIFCCSAWLWAGLSTNSVFSWTMLTSTATLVPNGRWVEWYTDRGHAMRAAAIAAHARAVYCMLFCVGFYPVVLFAMTHPLRATVAPLMFLWTVNEYTVRIYDKDWLNPAYVHVVHSPDDPVALARHRADAQCSRAAHADRSVEA